VLNWENAHGLVAFPNVIEYDQPGQWVELRAQVYGATVQSYSWDLSQAGRAGCVTDSNTYKLRFMWNGYSPIEGTQQVTVTATMTDSSTQQLTLTFKLSASQGMQCPGGTGGSGGGSSMSWPEVLTPDKPLASEEFVTSESVTRPYAVAQSSGVLYASHTFDDYDPGVPPLGLVYSSDAAERRPIFIDRYELNPSASVPNTVSARLQFNGTWGPSKYYDTSPSTTKHNPGNVLQISLQSDAGSLATGRYDYTVETTANYSGSSTTTTSSGTITLINEESSPFGEGWTLDLAGNAAGFPAGAFDRLHVVTGGVILNQGAGKSLWFASNGPNAFTTPAGDFSTLVKNGDNTYTRTLKTGVKQNFNSAGMQTSLVDLNNNTITFAYTDADSDGQVDELSTITDANGLVTTLAYPGTCGAGSSPARACTITDPAGRVTALQYNASGQLTRITDPDNAAWQFSYDTSSGRMTALTDPRNNTTNVSYNFAGRVTTITRPDATTEQFKALQLQSLCDSGQCTQASPGTPLLSAEAVADYSDARANAWDYRLDWRGFGTVTQITDPLGQSVPAGHMSVYHRDANGLATQFTDRLDRNSDYTRDAKGNVTQVRHPDRTSETFEYNTNSQLTRATDERGNVTTWTYDAEGNLTQITEPDPDGGGPLTSPITTFAHTADGFVQTVTDARNNQTVFTRDSRDRVTQEKFPDGDGDPNNNPTVSYVYDTASNVTSRTNERGYPTAYTFDSMGRVLSETDPLNHATSYLFDAAGNLTRVTNALNQATNFGYNNMNRLITVTDALNNVTNVTYDGEGNVTQVRDPINRTTTASYNALNYQTSTTTPLSNTTNYTRDAEAQTTGITDPLNNTQTAVYNNRGWTTSSTSPLNNTVSMGYDSSGNMTSQSYSGGGDSFQFDGLDRTTRFTNAINANTDYSYDAVGNVTSLKDPLNHSDTLAYDPRNRVITATNALNNSTQFLWDAASNLTRITDPLNRAVNRTFDAADRLTSITLPDPDGGGPLGNPVIGFGYDNADRLTSLTDPLNNTTSWTLDAAGRVTGDTNPLGSRAYVYNGAGELTQVTDRNGRVRQFVYDSDGRRTQEKWLDGGGNVIRTIGYGYDADGRLISSGDADFQYTFTYDADDRLSTISNSGTPNMPAVTLTNTYDGNDNRTAVSDNLSPAGSMSFSYDAAERMTAASLAVSGSTVAQISFSYDTANRLTLISRRTTGTDKTDTTNTYDNADRLTGITHQFIPSIGGSTTLVTYSYAYNAADELTTQTNSDGTLNYVYDATGQLTGVSGAFTESYSYDLNGNRAMTGYTIGTGNRLTSDGVYNYTYDNEGSLLTKTRNSDGQRWEFTWDYRKRLTQVLEKNSGGSVVKQANYVYDAFNRRIGATVDADGAGSGVPTTRWTMYDGVDLGAPQYIDWVDPDGSGPQSPALDSRRLSADAVDTVLARWTASGAVAWYLTDQLGSVRDVANNSGTVLDHINYDSFGNIRSESNPSNGDRFKFTGYEQDSESGLYHARARAYDPATGRFVSLDPVGFAAGDANLYRYVENAATTRVDPLGLDDGPPQMADYMYLDPDDPRTYPGTCGLDYAAWARDFAAWNTSPDRYRGSGSTGGGGGGSPAPGGTPVCTMGDERRLLDHIPQPYADPRYRDAMRELVEILRGVEDPPRTWRDYCPGLGEGYCHRWAQEALKAMDPWWDKYKDFINVKYLSPKYVGPVFWFFDHAIIEVRITCEDLGGTPHTVGCFYIDRAMYGGEDHIFFEWPSTVLYPGSQQERDYWERMKDHPSAATH
jgi:RHS repeat-associated protein